MPENRHTRYYTTRPRRVPPEWCQDPDLEACDIPAALLLYRIVSQADDQGRLPGHPKYIRAVCFGSRGYSIPKVDEWLRQLDEAGFIRRYEADGKQYVQVERWGDLQGKWGRRAYPSRYPAPPGWTQDWVPDELAESA